MKLCDYGCGQEAKFPFKNGKWCCSKKWQSCLGSRKKNSKSKKGKKTGPLSEETKRKMSETHKGKTLSEEHIKNISEGKKGKKTGACSEETKRKISKSMKGKNTQSPSKETRKKQSKSMKGKNKGKTTGPLSEETKRKISESMKYKLKDYKEKYPFFSKIEEMRYNPDKPEEKEIQVHCKNHNCKNSKEKGGWFTPTYNQFKDRKDFLENEGLDRSNFYCSQHCKDTCPLYNLHGDPYRNTNLPYTYAEYLTCRAVVFERENTLCEYCGEPATDMHHIFPVKIEPFFALDPDYCVACCEKHHYKYAHEGECSTGNLAKIVCSVESQKFLNQNKKEIK